MTVGRALSNGAVVGAVGAICFVAAYHLVCLVLASSAKPAFNKKKKEDKSGVVCSHKRGLLRFAVVFFFAILCGGKGLGSETIVMELLKNCFGRLRPPEYEHDVKSLAFPSGHSNGASYFSGVLLALVLPNLASSLGNESSGQFVSLRKARVAGVLLSVVWLCLVGSTAVGRVGQLKHWCSDCICGCFTGAITVGLAAHTTLALEKKMRRHLTKDVGFGAGLKKKKSS